MKIDYLIWPHCDKKVVHTKSDNCKYCNERPDLQYIREAWGIAFTGHSDATETYYDHVTGRDEQRPLIPCPSERDRTVADIHRWHGNRPQPDDLCRTHEPGECDGSGPSCLPNWQPPVTRKLPSLPIEPTINPADGHYHPDGTLINWYKPGIPQCPSMHGNQQCQWKIGHTGTHQECNECWNHN